ncbi:MAG: 4Fe-4S dicluster domain-containing protein [Chloroflexota bacterium]
MKRIYADETVCIGCHLCEVFCQFAHSPSKDLVKAFNKEAVRPLASVAIEEKRPVCFAVQCRHCDEPACVYACLTGALRKDSDTGVVTVDANKCVGCWTCVLACPVGAIQRDTVHGRIMKCDLCAGKEAPFCVTNCPNEALTYVEEKVGKGSGR